MDTERAEVDLKSSLSLMRVHIQRLGEKAKTKRLTEAEKSLITTYHYDIDTLYKEIRAVWLDAKTAVEKTYGNT